MGTCRRIHGVSRHRRRLALALSRYWRKPSIVIVPAASSSI
jgi:hypothetical protein